MSSSLMLGLKAGEIRKIWWVNCLQITRSVVRGVSAVSDPLLRHFWVGHFGTTRMASWAWLTQHVPRHLRRSWCLEMVWDEGLKCWMIRHPIVRMLCRCSSCVQGLWNGHDAPTNGFWVTGAEFFSTFSGLAFSMVVAHEFALVLGKLNFASAIQHSVGHTFLFLLDFDWHSCWGYVWHFHCVLPVLWRVSFGLRKYDVLKCSRCAGRILSNAKVLLHDKF